MAAVCFGPVTSISYLEILVHTKEIRILQKSLSLCTKGSMWSCLVTTGLLQLWFPQALVCVDYTINSGAHLHHLTFHHTVNVGNELSLNYLQFRKTLPVPNNVLRTDVTEPSMDLYSRAWIREWTQTKPHSIITFMTICFCCDKASWQNVSSTTTPYSPLSSTFQGAT